MNDKKRPDLDEIVAYLERYHRDEWGNVLLNAHYWPLFVNWLDGDGNQPIGGKDV